VKRDRHHVLATTIVDLFGPCGSTAPAPYGPPKPATADPWLDIVERRSPAGPTLLIHRVTSVNGLVVLLGFAGKFGGDVRIEASNRQTLALV